MTLVFRSLLVTALAGSAFFLSGCEEPSSHGRIYAGRPAYYQERPRYREDFAPYADDRPRYREVEGAYPAYRDRDYGDRYRYSEERSYPRASYGEVVIREREYPGLRDGGSWRDERERRAPYPAYAERHTYRDRPERAGRTERNSRDRGRTTTAAGYSRPAPPVSTPDYRRAPGTPRGPQAGGRGYGGGPVTGGRPPHAYPGGNRGAQPPAGVRRPGPGQPASSTQPTAPGQGNGKKKKVPQS